MDKKQLKPFGLWESPISPLNVSQNIRLNDVQLDSDGETIVWYEGRSNFGMLVAKEKLDAGVDLNGEISCRGGVGYGGGEFCVRNKVVIFAGKDGRLYRRDIGPHKPYPITPAFGSTASPQISPDGKHVVYVYSDGTTDVLGLVDVEGKNWPHKLVQGADFYMQPVWHPDGDMLAWVEWDHPNMPWDGSRLMVANLDFSSSQLVNKVQQVAGDAETVIFQPEFSADGKWLSYLSSAGEWDALVLVDLKTMEKKVLYQPDGCHLMEPAWVQGVRTYAWAPDSQSLYVLKNVKGTNSLLQIKIDSGEAHKIDTGDYTWLSQISVSNNGKIALIASNPGVPGRVIVWDENQWRIVARSSSENIPPAFHAWPKTISWKAEDDTEVFGLYYPPTNPDFYAEGKPPVIVYIHGGPTSQSVVEFNAQAAYYSSRGYGWLIVNYRGSTGYGHTYKKALNGHWGDYDVEDAVGGAKALVDQGLANEKQLVILGGSAGGYTVLNSLIRYPGVFKAGVCNYGVSSLFLLDLDTHKFEAHYTASLVGQLPAAAGKYYDWSPIYHADQIRDALAVFQGSEDKVVPPNQSELIVEKLKENRVPHIYKLYEGEGHGFRKNETLEDYYQSVERFLLENVLFAA